MWTHTWQTCVFFSNLEWSLHPPPTEGSVRANAPYTHAVTPFPFLLWALTLPPTALASPGPWALSLRSSITFPPTSPLSVHTSPWACEDLCFWSEFPWHLPKHLLIPLLLTALRELISLVLLVVDVRKGRPEEMEALGCAIASSRCSWRNPGSSKRHGNMSHAICDSIHRSATFLHKRSVSRSVCDEWWDYCKRCQTVSTRSEPVCWWGRTVCCFSFDRSASLMSSGVIALPHKEWNITGDWFDNCGILKVKVAFRISSNTLFWLLPLLCLGVIIVWIENKVWKTEEEEEKEERLKMQEKSEV